VIQPNTFSGGGIEKTLNIIGLIKPTHISAYSLILEENTPLFENKSSYVFPDENEEEAEYYNICSTLSKSCYKHYEVSSFALPGFESRHNLGYWKRDSYIGIGPAAHSFYQNRRFYTPSDISLFIQNAEKPFTGDTNFASVTEISNEEAEEERIMLGLRTSDGVSLNGDSLQKAKRFADAGFGKIEGDIFSLNDKGFRVSNSIICELL
ncbi:hypothetical protein EOM82_08700, partial [bacterium]|nr:hypothetical protein [bacterium]